MIRPEPSGAALGVSLPHTKRHCKHGAGLEFGASSLQAKLMSSRPSIQVFTL